MSAAADRPRPGRPSPASSDLTTRERLARAALEITRKKGAAAVTLQAAGKEAELSYQAAYRHFEKTGTLDNLLSAAAELAMDELYAFVEARTDPSVAGADVIDRLRALCLAYVDYALQEANVYRLLFATAVDDVPDELGEAASRLMSQYTLLIEEGQRTGRIRKGDPFGLAYPLSALTHGVAMYQLNKQLPRASAPGAVRRLARGAIDLMLDGMRARGMDFPLRVVQGHWLADLGDGYALLDTGAPASIGDGSGWPLEAPAPARSILVSLDDLSRRLGGRIRWLIGSDVLGRWPVRVDPVAGTVSFAAGPAGGVDEGLEIDLGAGVPVLRLGTAWGEVRAILDTGAWLSYMPAACAAGLDPLGRETDFHPSLGDFEVDVYETRVRLGEREVALRCGVLPPELARGLALLGDPWIVGTSAFAHRRLLLDYRHGRIIDQPVATALHGESPAVPEAFPEQR